MATQPRSPPPNASASKFEDMPYLKRLKQLESAFPALKSFVEKIGNEDQGRLLVKEHYRGIPGRCYCLQFEEDKVTVIEEYPQGFTSPEHLAKYFAQHPAQSSRQQKRRRLFILEDLDPKYVDVLGEHLGVDPLVFSEQMNTWNFTDSNSIPHRGLPSMCTPEQSFTLRYYETRTLINDDSLKDLTLQMTCAVNRRRYEGWRDIDLPQAGTKDKKHALIRRCASFWTSQDLEQEDKGWDDPSMTSGKIGSDVTYILRDPTPYVDRSALWSARPWKRDQDVKLVEHKSVIYHHGCPTIAQLPFPWDSEEAKAQMLNFQTKRDLASPLDEQVFYWTKVASKGLIQKANARSSNAAYYLLKHVAQHWTSQLELINCTIAMGEFLSDDYQAKLNNDSSQQQWKKDLVRVTEISKDINYLQRQMHHFWRSMILNLERLGLQIGCEQVDDGASLALRGAQKDLLTIHTRMQPLRDRVEALTNIASDLTNVHAAFRGLHDGELALWLGLFASIVFPLTLVANIFSMSDDYLPGGASFWKFWAISLPFAAAFGVVMVYGGRPHRFLYHVGVYIGFNRQGKKDNGADGRRGEISGNSGGMEASVDNIGEKQMPKARAESANSPC